ncbi:MULTISPECIES: TVP38/TMEM64 family protein [Pseudonocardia]|uniref:TVP38/TMEM64 family membrane protein n=1 Tax=Pseudonocardia autotrophica TaxID=2074 RepID=A0A1Y2MMT5_PSEAH|nr:MULTISPECIES: VTT domain-containing protein [Pseudonocardia]OSY36565.1 TVP38/TMEM64 family inner membrane protein YdjZ [Pseudonocardia autotrophica]TDN76253.1 putative membrane protein YdjX (TVP38/TMEM64 family) [Pseudonocardia autotrophica]
MRWWRPLLGCLGLVLVVSIVVMVARAYGLSVVPQFGEVRRVVEAAGPWGPVVFVLLQVLLNVPPFPRTVFTVSAGVLFGAVVGTALAIIATALAAVVAFALVRLTGGGIIGRWAEHPRALWVRRRLDHHGTLAVTSMRLIPMVPFAVMNYLSGLSAVRFWPYLIGTVVGSTPSTIAIVTLGDAVTGHVKPSLLLVSALCGVVGLIGVVVAARRPIPEEPAS